MISRAGAARTRSYCITSVGRRPAVAAEEDAVADGGGAARGAAAASPPNARQWRTWSRQRSASRFQRSSSSRHASHARSGACRKCKDAPLQDENDASRGRREGVESFRGGAAWKKGERVARSRARLVVVLAGVLVLEERRDRVQRVAHEQDRAIVAARAVVVVVGGGDGGEVGGGRFGGRRRVGVAAAAAMAHELERLALPLTLPPAVPRVVRLDDGDARGRALAEEPRPHERRVDVNRAAQHTRRDLEQVAHLAWFRRRRRRGVRWLVRRNRPNFV